MTTVQIVEKLRNSGLNLTEESVGNVLTVSVSRSESHDTLKKLKAEGLDFLQDIIGVDEGETLCVRYRLMASEG